jgi:SNF2 family DNA or RNA helicase
MANGVLAELTRLKQFANSCARLTDDEDLELMLPSNKLQWFITWLAERGIEKGGVKKGGKVILASPSSKLLDLVEQEMERLEIPSTKIHGGITGGRRQQAAHTFQDPNSGVRLMLLGTKAGGVSLTLDQADDIVFFGETWDPDDQTQVEDRADRVSRSNHQVTVWYVRSLGTLEEAIAADNESLDKINHELMDGRRGVKRAKQLLHYKSHRSTT